MAFELLIDGELVSGHASLDVVNPATGAVFAKCARADADDLDRAVSAAKAAFPAWSALPWSDRAACLSRLADSIDAHSAELARILTAEQGKPLAQAEFEVMISAAAFRFFGGLELEPKVLIDEPEAQVIEHYAPLGVVAAITPWNFPLILLAVKLAAALAAGNTVVAKPAPTTPLSSLKVGELAAAVLPRGVLNIIVDQNDLGDILSAHPDIAKVTFTGSTATGRKVMQSAASTLKRLTLELGGNDAAIILDDADIQEVAPKIFAAAMMNAGQVCMAAKRVYVPADKLDAWCEALAKLAEEAVVGDGLDPATQIGPIQNRMQYDKVVDLIEDSKRSGTIVAGGETIKGPGFFVRPTIVRDLPDDARLVQEEQFGPVLPVLSYRNLDEVIARANDSEFGLAGTIWGRDVSRAIEVAKRIQTGTVWINKHLDLRFDVAFGGAKQSGIGREQGIDGLKEFVDSRVINIAKA